MTQRIQVKRELLAVLGQTDLEKISVFLKSKSESALLNPLFSALYRTEELIRWHAVTAFGLVVDSMARKDMESARVVMRRFLWSLNDESGGIGWGAPEAMAEIMAQSDSLFHEYAHMLFSYMREDGSEPFQDGNFLELPELQRGVVWGIGRLAEVYGDILVEKGIVDDLIPYIHSQDAVVRGMAVWALGNLQAVSAKTALESLGSDQATIGLYDKGLMLETKISDLVQRFLSSIG